MAPLLSAIAIAVNVTVVCDRFTVKLKWSWRALSNLPVALGIPDEARPSSFERRCRDVGSSSPRNRGHSIAMERFGAPGRRRHGNWHSSMRAECRLANASR